MEKCRLDALIEKALKKSFNLEEPAEATPAKPVAAEFSLKLSRSEAKTEPVESTMSFLKTKSGSEYMVWLEDDGAHRGIDDGETLIVFFLSPKRKEQILWWNTKVKEADRDYDYDGQYLSFLAHGKSVFRVQRGLRPDNLNEWSILFATEDFEPVKVTSYIVTGS